MPTLWTDERVEILKSRWAEDWTASAIAGLIGCTRNAVIGKAHRLGLPESIHRSGRPVTPGAKIVNKIVKRTRAATAARGSRAMRVRSAPLALASHQRGDARLQRAMASGQHEHFVVAAPAPRAAPGHSAARLAPGLGLVELPVATDEPVSRRIALADLKPGECGWIAGDDGCCCGHATAQMFARGRRMASPYCAFHSARAYRVPAKKSA